eukprot:CAMPEP_0170421266 /NCGR_PEP_ID=MMETSP0117_2-20130122/35804_1 /TAXON_ID=400756 /ORGANISM="Durinskia baltica, Strain CSIRO CS-38" /LENGTH=35 /DNA_ID= /DNA_START= /DNA_END= /DNA_ORIENTATION=
MPGAVAAAKVGSAGTAAAADIVERGGGRRRGPAVR